MTNCHWIRQDPAPGTRILRFRGDTQTFQLKLSEPRRGNAWLRTNIGYARIKRREIIREVHCDEAPLERDWFDTPMNRIDDRHFRINLPLCEVGHFEAKCFFAEDGETHPRWPQGSNTTINVEPADTCSANIIYNAFVRQFGPNKSGQFKPPLDTQDISVLDKTGYTVIPPSGTFRDLVKELDFIVGELGCRVIQLLPIHPTPTTYARMGRFGSPYAALSFTAVDPALAEFDASATPLEQFIELVDAVHARNAKIIIDIAINHTGWAAGLHESHPRWLVRNTEGEIEVPGAWGVRWADLTKLDYAHRDLWQYMAEVFLTWCRRGADGFRCDAGYMIPLPAWAYIIARVREEFPDTIFNLEGLGGKISVTRDLLNRANFNWAYSELFQNYDRGQIERYLPGALEMSDEDGIPVHFAETHDNPRLADRSQTYARMRTALCALFSHVGAFGFANGVEWFATEKIIVHDAPSLSWGAQPNQVPFIRRLNALLRVHPAFSDQCRLSLIQAGEGNHVVMLREHPPTGTQLLIIVNLDDRHPTRAAWQAKGSVKTDPGFFDLLAEEKIIATRSGELLTVDLKPGQVLCLTSDSTELDPIQKAPLRFLESPERVLRQGLRAKALDVFTFFHGIGDIGAFNSDLASDELREDPIRFCRRTNPHSHESQVVTWQWPQDRHREVMLPPGFFLLVRAAEKFRARIIDNHRTVGAEDSLPAADGSYFALFNPLLPPKSHRQHTLKITVFSAEGFLHREAPLLLLQNPEKIRVQQYFLRNELVRRSLLFLGTNGRGGMLRAGVSWGKLKSRYDALLAANLSPDNPEDRQVLFTRCRAWLVYEGYSQEIGDDCLTSFRVGRHSKGSWDFRIPCGQGESVALTIEVEMMPDQNAARLIFFRHPADNKNQRLDDHHPVQLILRPDIENRSFHDTIKAYQGPENQWPASVTTEPNGFSFWPKGNCRLRMDISRGEFTPEPEWHYMVHRPLEAERGLDPDSDLFSPGYFSIVLKGGRHETLTANADDGSEPSSNRLAPFADPGPAADKANFRLPVEVLQDTLNHYVIRRGSLKSVIAGYPWFLDWGRDSLIFVRGLIAANRLKDARTILQQFGQFEKDGTIPNMIHGKDAGNRDTSDAPLWFFVACRDLVKTDGNDAFLESTWGKRTLRRILLSMGHSLKQGTPNGIYMDPDSALLFSPAHFTWMDTNHPAGTPREGYPVEIQALWYTALRFLSRIDSTESNSDWKRLAEQVRSSIADLYYMEKIGYFCDCLIGQPGTPAKQAEQDDALRPNQLLALTLGAVNDEKLVVSVLGACEELLVPGAIRSLADRAVERPLAIMHHGNVINNPHHPYLGRYEGDEDTRRKPAYHNGTAWTWLFPSYCEAWAMVYDKQGRRSALAWLGSAMRLLEHGCVGHVPEILDGDYPHKPRGCDAQAWGASELLRVWLKLSLP